MTTVCLWYMYKEYSIINVHTSSEKPSKNASILSVKQKTKKILQICNYIFAYFLCTENGTCDKWKLFSHCLYSQVCFVIAQQLPIFKTVGKLMKKIYMILMKYLLKKSYLHAKQLSTSTNVVKKKDFLWNFR